MQANALSMSPHSEHNKKFPFVKEQQRVVRGKNLFQTCRVKGRRSQEAGRGLPIGKSGADRH